jgi:hypothetical protein
LSKKKNVSNYNNYEGKIVETFGVALEGWPKGVVQNPGSVGWRPQVTVLLKALQSSTCHWTKLTANELDQRILDNQAQAAAGEPVYKPRRGRKPKGKSATVVEDSDEDSGKSDSPCDDDDEDMD